MELFLVWAASVGLIFSVSSFFDIHTDIKRAVLWILLWSFGILLVTLNNRWRYYILAGVLLIWMVRLWYRWEQIVEERDILYVMFLAVLIIGISVYLYRSNLVLMIMSVLFVAAMLYYDRYPDYKMIFLWFASVFAMRATGKNGAGRSTFWMFFISLIVMAVAHEKFSKPVSANLWEYSAEVRYFQQRLNMHWEGIVRSIDNRTDINGRLDNGNPGNNKGIDVVVYLEEKPQTNIYLRGFVGGEYNSEGWEVVSDQEFQNYMLTWNLGSAQSVQAELLNDYYNRMEIVSEVEAQQLNLQNLNYKGEYALVPYGCKVNRQGNFWADGLVFNSGADEFVYEVYPVDMKQMLADDNDDGTDNLKLYYTQYAKQYYLDGWQQLENLQQVCADFDNTNFYTAQDSIKKYLGVNCGYSKELDPVPYGTDYTEFFLFTEKKGYCAHFATAATLMFRAMGYPARYAAGYVASPKDFVKADENSYKAEITGNRAHAWVEVLIDGIWYPVEMTPGYTDTAISYDEMLNQEQEETETSEEELSEESDLEEEPEDEEEDEETDTNTDELLLLGKGWKKKGTILIRMVLLLPILAVCVLLRRWGVLVLYRLVFQKYGNRRAVLFQMRKTMRMVRRAGYACKGRSDLEYVQIVKLEEFGRMMQLAQKAKFSKQDISGSEKENCWKDSILLEEHLYEGLSKTQRIWWKYGWCFR